MHHNSYELNDQYDTDSKILFDLELRETENDELCNNNLKDLRTERYAGERSYNISKN